MIFPSSSKTMVHSVTPAGLKETKKNYQNITTGIFNGPPFKKGSMPVSLFIFNDPLVYIYCCLEFTMRGCVVCMKLNTKLLLREHCSLFRRIRRNGKHQIIASSALLVSREIE